MKPRWFYLLLAVEVVVIAIIRWPRVMSLSDFAHADTGAVLNLARLTAEGLRPGIDFTYLYGLGTAAFGDIVFSVCGLSPRTYAYAGVGLGVLFALAVGYAVVAAGVRGPGYAIVVVGIALGMPLPAPNFVHLLEPILLSVAVAGYARGRPAFALAAATVAVFLKPSLAYPCGLLIILDGLATVLRERKHRVGAVLIRRLLPAAVTALVLGSVLALKYGLASLFATIFPADGLSVYQAEGFGFFFGKGRSFWDPPGANAKFYLGTPSGFWIVGTLILTVAAIFTLIAWARGKVGDPADRTIVACGLLHITFILFIFGPPTAWFYDFNMLLIGLAAVVSRVTCRSIAGWTLVGVELLGCYSQVVGDVRTWQECVCVPGTPGLYARSEVAADWNRLTELAKLQRVFVFNYLGGATVLSPQLSTPASWCFYWWLASETEIDRIRDQLRAADVVAIPRYFSQDEWQTHPARAPAFLDVIHEFQVVDDWPSYRVYRRLGTP